MLYRRLMGTTWARSGRRRRALLFGAGCALAAAWGCAAGGDEDDAGGASAEPPDASGRAGAGGSGNLQPGGANNSGGVGGGTLPPEAEVAAPIERPQAGQNYVYAVNPDSDTVAVIHATTLAIHTVEAGDDPRYLQTLAGEDRAIVLNAGSDDATIIRTTNGTSTTQTVDVMRGANAIAVAPDGKHAVVYFDVARRSGPARTGSFQDVTVLDLSGEQAVSVGMTVGFQPSAVQFSEDGNSAFVITEDGVSIIDFVNLDYTTGSIAPTVAVAQGLDYPARDVSVTGNGKYAVARSEAEVSLRLVDLTTRQTTVLDLSQYAPEAPDGTAGAGGEDGGEDPQAERGVITDVDLSPESDVAFAVIRGTSTLLRIPLPGGFTDPSTVTATTISDNLIGSVTLSDDAKYALLYTTALDTAERLTILDLENTAAPRTIALKKAIRSVAIAPDRKTALLLHKKLPGDPNQQGIDEEELIDVSYGYTAVKLETGFAKLELTPADVSGFTVVPDSSALFLLLNQPAAGVRMVHRMSLSNFEVTPFTLGSPPVSIGVVPQSTKVFVGQEHPDGRLTFIDWKSLDLKSVTGFELNSKIRE